MAPRLHHRIGLGLGLRLGLGLGLGLTNLHSRLLILVHDIIPADKDSNALVRLIKLNHLETAGMSECCQ